MFCLLMMGWLYSFGGNAIMHRLGGGCGRYILFAGARHILFWGIYVVYGLVQNTMMLLVSHYLPFSFSILLCTDIIFGKFGVGRYILFAGARHILSWGIYVVYGLVQNTMMLFVSHYLPFSFSMLLCTDIIIRFGKFGVLPILPPGQLTTERYAKLCLLPSA
jgi:hypothetical protein